MNHLVVNGISYKFCKNPPNIDNTIDFNFLISFTIYNKSAFLRCLFNRILKFTSLFDTKSLTVSLTEFQT